MKNNKRTLSMLLAGVMTASLAAGCAGGSKEPEKGASPEKPAANAQSDGKLKLPLTETPVTYRYFIKERADAAVKNDWPIALELAKRTNVKLQFEAVPGAGFDEKKKIAIATNSIPDIVSGLTAAEGRQYGPDGLFLNIKPYMDKGLMPNIKKLYEKYPDMKTVSTAPDGGIYAIPNLAAEGWFSFAWMGRKDVLDQYGLKLPTNTDELYNVLKAIKEKEPASYPFTMREIRLNQRYGLFNDFSRAFTEVSVIGYNPFTKKYEFAAEKPGFKDMLVYLNKLFKEGLLDPEFALLKVNQWEERILTNKSHFTLDFKNRYDQFTTNAKKADANTKFNMTPVQPIAAPGKKPYTFASPIVDIAKNNVALSKNIKNPEIAVQFLDYLFSEEGAYLTELGIEGVTHTTKDGKPSYLPTIAKPEVSTMRKDFGARYDEGLMFVEKGLGRIAENYFETNKVLEDLYKPFVVEAAPAVLVTEKEQELEKEKKPNVEKYLEQKLTEFVMGRTAITDAAVAEMVAQANKLGAADLVKMYNEQVERTKK